MPTCSPFGGELFPLREGKHHHRRAILILISIIGVGGEYESCGGQMSRAGHASDRASVSPTSRATSGILKGSKKYEFKVIVHPQMSLFLNFSILLYEGSGHLVKGDH